MKHEKPKVAFGTVTRDHCGLQRVQAIVDRWDLDAPLMSMVGHSCVATARCSLGAEMANSCPSDVECVVLLDDDVCPSLVALKSAIVSAVSSARSGHPTVYVVSYPIRLPEPTIDDPLPGDDKRLAHLIDLDDDIWGGLGCVAIPIATFRWLHLGDWTQQYQVVRGGTLSTCPYRVGPHDGQWMTEDVYFFAMLKKNGIRSRMVPYVARHGTQSADASYSQLNGMSLKCSPSLSFE
jgi:hypothetical protein